MDSLLFYTAILCGCKLFISCVFLVGQCKCATLGMIDRGRYRRGVEKGTIEKRPVNWMTLEEIENSGILDLSTGNG